MGDLGPVSELPVTGNVPDELTELAAKTEFDYDADAHNGPPYWDDANEDVKRQYRDGMRATLAAVLPVVRQQWESELAAALGEEHWTDWPWLIARVKALAFIHEGTDAARVVRGEP